MSIRQLRIFNMVCMEGSVTKAAKKLYMAQPAVSLAIRELEEEYQIKLFDRISKRLYLTESGRIFLGKTRNILDLYDEMERDVKTWGDQIPLHLGSSITIGTCVLPALLHAYKKENGNPVNITIDNALKVENLLLENQVDIALIEGIVRNPALISIPFMENVMVVCAGKHHPLANQKHIKITQLLDEDFYLREIGSATRDIFDSALLTHSLAIKPVMSSVNSQALIEAIKWNQGITVLPYSLVEHEVTNGNLVILPVEDIDLHQYYYLSYHKDKYLNKAAAAFMKTVKETYDVTAIS